VGGCLSKSDCHFNAFLFSHFFAISISLLSLRGQRTESPKAKQKAKNVHGVMHANGSWNICSTVVHWEKNKGKLLNL